jgi:ribosomal protein S7
MDKEIKKNHSEIVEEEKEEMESTKKRVNAWTKAGEKAIVERRVQETMRERERRYWKPGQETSKTGEERRKEILSGLKPVIETKSVKRGGRSHQVPTPVSERRGRYRACSWIREATMKRAKKMGVSRGVARRLELVALYEELKRREQGGVGVKRQTEPRQMRERMHRAAKANRVFAS